MTIRPQIRATHTEAVLEVSKACFDEIVHRIKKVAVDLNEPSYLYEYTDARSMEDEIRELHMGKLCLVVEEGET